METVKTLMERLSQMDENTPIAVALWTPEDVEGHAEDNGETLTDAEVATILDRMNRHHDCEYGITWDTLNNEMIDVINERE